MATFTGINITGGETTRQIADALIALDRTLEFQMATLGTDNILEIGGWVLGPTSLSSRTLDVGMSSSYDQTENVRFWAGNMDMNNAPYRVYDTGRVVMTNATMSGGSINWGNVVKPTYGPSEVGALASNSPQLTYIGPYGIYTGTLNANQINVGTLTGFTIQTGVSGNRIVLDSQGLHSTDSSGTERIAIYNTDVTDTPNTSLHFFNEYGSKIGRMRGAGSTFEIYSSASILFGASGGVVMASNTAYFDFMNVPIRNFNFNLTAKFG